MHGLLATVSRIFSHTVTEQSHSGQRGCCVPLASRSGVVPAGYNLSGLLVNVLLCPVVDIVRLFGEPFQDFLFGFLRVPFVAEPANVCCVQHLAGNRHIRHRPLCFSGHAVPAWRPFHQSGSHRNCGESGPGSPRQWRCAHPNLDGAVHTSPPARTVCRRSWLPYCTGPQLLPTDCRIPEASGTGSAIRPESADHISGTF